MKRRDLLLGLLASPFVARSARAAGINIILLIADDMTFEQIRRMPQLHKRLGLTGVNFLNALANTPLCQPARAIFVTGQLAHNNGIVDNLTPYTNLGATPLLAARLQAAGYRTSHVGKYLNTYAVTDGVITGWNDWHAMDQPAYFGYPINDNGVITTRVTALADYGTTVCTEKATAFIASTTEPFFLQVGYSAPHFNNNVGFFASTPSPAYAGTVPGSKTFPQDPNYGVPIVNPPAYMSVVGATPFDATMNNNINSFWRGQTEMLFSVDRSIQAIMDALAASGKTNTVVIFVSDNGYMHGEHRDPTEKIVPYYPDVRIPLIISGPSGTVAQNKVCDRLVAHVDIVATIYALTGATSSRVLDGVSLLPLLANPASAELRTAVLVEWLGTLAGGTGAPPNRIENVPDYQAVMSRSHVYGEYQPSDTELYDLVADPYQLVNQTGNASFASVKASLAATLASIKNCSGASCII